MSRLHTHEVAINEAMVKALLKEQFPQWQHLELTYTTSSGTDHVLYRLGDKLCVRLPRIPDASHQIALEKRWLPYLEKHLPLNIPRVIAEGEPQAEYPLNWGIYQWLEGSDATNSEFTDSAQTAIDLANFITSIQMADNLDAPKSVRGIPLIQKDTDTRKAIAALKDELNETLVTSLWEESLQTPKWTKEPVWVHGDLLPSNLLVNKGRVTSIIDFGLFGVGDPACDLLPAWSVLDKSSREIFKASLNMDEATWLRGRGWALSIALIILPYYRDTNSDLVTIARRILHEILEEQL